MTRAWQTLASVQTQEGVLALRQRGASEFLIVLGGRVLMTSVSRRSEEALATLSCAPLATRSAPRVLIGGLGMGFTLRAALDVLPASAKVVVAELNPEVIAWCQGPLSGLTSDAVSDPRTRIELADVASLVAAAPAGAYDAILLDLYEGPHAATQRPADPFYGTAALSRTRRALRQGGVMAVWSEDADLPFERRLAAAGFAVSRHRKGQGGRAHFVYLGVAGSLYASDSGFAAWRAAGSHPRRPG
jgi:spermidine synthase